ncbi:TetR/AcrR family transcriptional regulator C-terminal domain-containing protein [Microbacterium sp. LjRoot45]
MRRVAGELGVEAMSLYNHVSDKGDLETALVGRVWAAVDLALDEPDGRKALHRLSGSAHRALRAHPWFFRLSLPRNGGVERLTVIEATLGHLARLGLDDGLVFHALHVIDGFVYGYSWQASEFDGVDEPADADIERMLEPYPRIRAHAAQHGSGDIAGDGFDIGLDLLLDGLLLRAQPGVG